MHEYNRKALLTEKEAASLLSVSVHWLRKRRATGGGPAFVKFCGLVRYQPAHLDAFMTTHSYLANGVRADDKSEDGSDGCS